MLNPHEMQIINKAFRRNEPPEPIECNPENYNFHDCYFCVNREDCKKEYEENEPTNFERSDK